MVRGDRQKEPDGGMDGRISARLAGHLAAVVAAGSRLCRVLPRPGDRGALGADADPAGTGLCAVFSRRAVRDRFRRPSHRACHRGGRRRAWRRGVVRRSSARRRAAAFGGPRIGLGTAAAGAVLGVAVSFDDPPPDAARPLLLLIYVTVSGLIIWGTGHYRSIASHYREISKRLIEEETYRKLVVEELQHRLKNKLSTIHAVLHQVLQNQPQVWASIDGRIRALSATDDLIARVDGKGCDMRELLVSALGPYGHVRFALNGEPLFLPAKLAVSLALMFHELATNASKYGAFSSPRGLLQVSWLVAGDRLTIVWDETEGPPIEAPGAPGFGPRLLPRGRRRLAGP